MELGFDLIALDRANIIEDEKTLIVEPFKTTGFHRTLTDYSQTLYENGLLISRLVEPRPTARAVSKHPTFRKVTKIPQSIIIEAIKR